LREVNRDRFAASQPDQITRQSPLPAVHDLIQRQVIPPLQPGHRNNIGVFMGAGHESPFNALVAKE
jgi:hypothetical protein